MHSVQKRQGSSRGSVFITSIIMVAVLAIAAASVLSLVMSGNRNSMRNEMRMRARTVAESELEAIFFRFKLTVQVDGTFPSDIPSKLSGMLDTTTIPTTVRDCFLDSHRDEGWKVKRSLVFEDASYGQIPGTRKSGWVSYVVGRVEVIPPDGIAYGGANIRVGRRFSLSTASVIQYGIFYENDLEFNPGSDVEVQGDISSNKSIYMGSTATGNMIIGAMVRYPKDQFCNKLADGTVTYRKPGTPLSGGSDTAPIWAAGGEADQTEQMDSPENLIGGLDAKEVMKRRPDLFATENDVYRAVIVPPPGDTHEYSASLSDDPTINAIRIYTKANLRINVETDGTINFLRGGVNVNSEFTGVATAPVTMMDQREGVNVKVATLDMAALKTKLDAIKSGGVVSKQFNGILYINQKSGSSSTPTAVMIVNSRETPETTNSAGQDLGFTLATNGGLYIKGSYNTIKTATTGVVNPSVLMADAVTLLSDDWNMANAASPIDDATKPRLAGTTMNPDGAAVIGASASSTISVQVNAGILTGNTPASSSYASGGAQNLIRYLERWKGGANGDLNTKIYGSLGCLFTSSYFNRPFQQPGSVYIQPSRRYFSYNEAMRKSPPAGAPSIPSYNRGAFFSW